MQIHDCRFFPIAAAGVVLAAVLSAPANAQEINRAGMQLMNDPGWRTAVEGVEVHLPSLTAHGMQLDFWRRSEVNDAVGRWAYVKILADCSDGTHIPFATINPRTGFFAQWAEADDRSRAAWRDDAKSKHITNSICARYAHGEAEIGSITRLPDPPKEPRGPPARSLDDLHPGH